MTHEPTADVELVVLLDEHDRPCGTAPKHEVHHRDTPLHLAFSCWVVDGQDRTLLTRRAATKRTWPGAWTNTFCGHPGPGEPIVAAIHRRAAAELGMRVVRARPVLPDFRYRAVMADGTAENEVCPVYVAGALGAARPDPGEVGELRWVPLAELAALTAGDPDAFSPWMLTQLAELTRLGYGAALGSAEPGAGEHQQHDVD